MANDTLPQNHLTNTITALKQGLTSIPISAAMDNTEAWQQEFLQSGIPALQDIARELGNLQSLLTAPKLNGPDIGRSLSLLGSQTTQYAFQASAEQQADIRSIGDLLLRLGTDLQNQPS
ncbi:hypothetical protein [Hymenobacter chitinivorans]|uniref:Uncharacterized protein n=1 Tax=Hymenobacter chitinivorans DSM 11115 TaxID=1121954 RepID=A0A2M9BLF1_9BACT|nr:hypothetical protein [Hymenobacter chitinivorans]PJJ58762.1 hypothetical protein CLV45_0172 [Hymenobacter chitinivorans DSM 11115]